jgi:hypothetical protein
MTADLSDGTKQRLEKLFSGEERQAVANLLIHECGCNLPFCDNASPEDLERIRFAVLKLSAGDTAKLLDSIVLAQTDWRDLLMAAGFGEDVEAHSAWWPP